MHQAEFFFYAGAKDGGGVFRRVLLVPFLPVAGFLVSFRTDEESWEIRTVTWHHQERKFVCCLGEDIDPQEDWQHMKARYLPQGWTLERELCKPHEPVRGRAPRWLDECRGEG